MSGNVTGFFRALCHKDGAVSQKLHPGEKYFHSFSPENKKIAANREINSYQLCA